MKGGTFGTLPAWALEALPTLSPTAALVLVRLAYAARLRNPAVTRGELLDYTTRSADQLARALKELEEAGHIRTCSGGYALKDAGADARKTARTNARKNAVSAARNLRPEQQKTIPEEVEEEEKEASYASSARAEEKKSEKKTDDAALRFFHALCGYGFVANNRDHLARWHEAYSEEFIRLAWQLAPTLTSVKVPQVAFIWLLNREKPWPADLQRQYQRDQQKPEGSAPDAPFIGEIRVMRDGRSGRVTEVDAQDRKLTLQIGEDDADALWVPWSVTEPAVRRSA